MKINKKNLIVYVSSRNNYDMLDGEVLKNIDFDGFELINIDDCSIESEILKGKKICKENNVQFLKNKGRGVQLATQTLVDFINKNRPECKWIICFQHDNYPISKNFFNSISKYINTNSLEKFGIIGFNNLDFGSYTLFSYYKYLIGMKPLGMIGILHFSKYFGKGGMWLCPRKQRKILKNKLWNKPFIVEFPMWASVGINIKKWNNYVIPTENYHFHLWLPDIAMQLNSVGFPCLILPNLYCFNNQYLKKKYGIAVNSAQSSKEGNNHHFGEYSNLKYWQEKWGWDYINPRETIDLDKYKGTLFEEFYNHDINCGPLRNIKL